MKYFYLVLLSTVLVAGVYAAEETLNLKDEKARVSYSIGYQVGRDFKGQEIDINSGLLLKGVSDAMTDSTPLMSHKDMRATLVDLQKKMADEQKKQMKAQAEKNMAEGRAFLAENGKKDSVHVLPSGLQYKILTEGSGQKPKASDTVTVHYRGTLINGTEFDSSYSRGKPASFRADRVIKGWKEALQLMREGAKWQLFIPPDLAYGERRTGRIGPNSTLIFEVELISVKSEQK